VVATSDVNGHLVGTGSSSSGFLTSYGQALCVEHGRATVKSNSNGVGVFLASPGNIADGDPKVIGGSFGKELSEAWSTCSLPVSTTNAKSPYNYSKSTIGASDGSASSQSRDPIAADLFEIIVYERILDKEERDRVIAYLAKKYEVAEDTESTATTSSIGATTKSMGTACRMMSNDVEVKTGTAPDDADTDDDIFEDGDELNEGSDPRDPDSTPIRADAEDLSDWEVEQFADCAQDSARWTVTLSGRRAHQAVNANPSIFLGGSDVGSSIIHGRMSSTSAPDFMGFVFGYQNRGNFYLFDWKKTTANWCGSTASRGMRLRVFTTETGEDPPDGAFWGGAHPGVTTLAENDVPWVDSIEYRFRLFFSPGIIRIQVFDDHDKLVEDWNVCDDTFADGRFGLWDNSLQDVTYSEIVIECNGNCAELLDLCEACKEDQDPTDSDGDGIRDRCDNCPDHPNPDQSDQDVCGGGVFRRGEANADGSIDISDGVRIFAVLFLGDVPLAAPGATLCGADPTHDSLDCVEYDCTE
jgi:hypothetical protein